MYKENFVDFELPDPELVEQLKAEYKAFMTPETLAQIEDFKKSISNNKEHFDYLKEMYEQLRSELTIFFPKEMSHPRELTEAQLEKEYESFQETENYSKLSDKIDETLLATLNINKATLIKRVVFLVIFLNFDLNSVNSLDVLYKIVDIFKEKPDLLNAIDNMWYYLSRTFIVYNFIKYRSNALKNTPTNAR